MLTRINLVLDKPNPVIQNCHGHSICLPVQNTRDFMSICVSFNIIQGFSINIEDLALVWGRIF
jgi:hypothetical protein